MSEITEVIGIGTSYGLLGMLTLVAFVSVILYSFVPSINRMDNLAHLGILATSTITAILIQVYAGVGSLIGEGLGGDETTGIAVFVILLISIGVIGYNLMEKSELLKTRRRS
jgi:hypothetical protein